MKRAFFWYEWTQPGIWMSMIAYETPIKDSKKQPRSPIYEVDDSMSIWQCQQRHPKPEKAPAE